MRPSGRKYWRYRHEVVVAGRRLERLYSFGDFVLSPSSESAEVATQRQAGGQFTLAKARMEHDRVRGLVRQGLCPLQKRKRLLGLRRESSATTFALLADEWIAIQTWEDVTKSRRRQMLQRIVMPATHRPAAGQKYYIQARPRPPSVSRRKQRAYGRSRGQVDALTHLWARHRDAALKARSGQPPARGAACQQNAARAPIVPRRSWGSGQVHSRL